MLYDRRLLAYKDGSTSHDKLNLIERCCEYQRDIRDLERKLAVCNQILRIDAPTSSHASQNQKDSGTNSLNFGSFRVRDRRPWIDRQMALSKRGSGAYPYPTKDAVIADVVVA